MAVAGVAVGMTVCAPFGVLDGAAQARGQIAKNCGVVLDKALGTRDILDPSRVNPGFGGRIYKGTRRIRKGGIDLTPTSRAIRSIASCYQKSPDIDKKLKAYLNLKALRDGQIYSFLPPKEKHYVKTDLQEAYLQISDLDQKTIEKQEAAVKEAYSKHIRPTFNPMYWQKDKISFLLISRSPANMEEAKKMCAEISSENNSQWQIPHLDHIQSNFYNEGLKISSLKNHKPVVHFYNKVNIVYSFKAKDRVKFRPEKHRPLLLCLKI